MDLIKIIIYSTFLGKEPYSDWEGKLDIDTKAIVKNRLDRVRLGNFGDAKMVRGASGIWELRINHGPGYRIYLGKDGANIVILLMGGNKGSQMRDIAKAMQYWIDYKESR